MMVFGSSRALQAWHPAVQCLRQRNRGAASPGCCHSSSHSWRPPGHPESIQLGAEQRPIRCVIGDYDHGVINAQTGVLVSQPPKYGVSGQPGFCQRIRNDHKATVSGLKRRAIFWLERRAVFWLDGSKQTPC